MAGLAVVRPDDASIAPSGKRGGEIGQGSELPNGQSYPRVQSLSLRVCGYLLRFCDGAATVGRVDVTAQRESAPALHAKLRTFSVEVPASKSRSRLESATGVPPRRPRVRNGPLRAKRQALSHHSPPAASSASIMYFQKTTCDLYALIVSPSAPCRQPRSR